MLPSLEAYLPRGQPSALPFPPLPSGFSPLCWAHPSLREHRTTAAGVGFRPQDMLCESSSLEALAPRGQWFRQPGGLWAVHGEDAGRFQQAKSTWVC